MISEDHPQYRFHKLMKDLELAPRDVRPWADTPPVSPERNRLVSLALRPAPVTHAWMSEGPKLTQSGQGLRRKMSPWSRPQTRVVRPWPLPYACARPQRRARQPR